MPCGCSPVPGSYTPPSTSTFSGRPVCPLPVRTSTPPTVPQIFNWLPRLRQKNAGKLLVADNDEMGVLDSPVDGVVQFDASTGNAWVGDLEVSRMPDNYGCAETAVYGWPAYGVRPECGGSALFPSRDVGFIRPVESSTGTLFAHQRSCALPGQAQELTPVEIRPDAWPATIPDGIMSMSVVKSDASECGSVQYRFYLNPGQSIVPNANLLLFNFPDRDLVPEDDANFRIAVWAKLDSGRFQLKSTPNTAFQAYIDKRIGEVLTDEGFAPTYLNPRQTLVTQTSNEIFPYIYGPYDLSAFPGYNANSTEVQLWITSTALIPEAGTLRYSFYVKVNGVVKYSSFAGPDPTGCRATGEVHVPIPPNKILQIEVAKEIYATGPSGPPSLGSIDVYLEAFK